MIDLEDLKEGMELDGVVRNVVDFGAFVDIGVHHDGLVHISEISNGYVGHPSEALKVGDKVKVKVIGVDVDKQRINLSMKQASGAAPRPQPQKRENFGKRPHDAQNNGAHGNRPHGDRKDRRGNDRRNDERRDNRSLDDMLAALKNKFSKH